MSPLITEIPHNFKTFQGKYLSRNIDLKPGQIIRGVVTQKLHNGEMVVAARGKQILAHSSLELNKGDQYEFLVKSTGDRVELKVLDGKNASLKSPVHLWASGQSVRSKLSMTIRDLASAQGLKGVSPDTAEAANRLSKLMPSLIFNNRVEDGRQWLTNFLAGSGLFWENKVARQLLGGKDGNLKKLWIGDLKGILMTMGMQLKADGINSPELQDLALKIQAALQSIEQDQFLNLSSIREDWGWFWFIPGLESDGFRKAEVFVEKAGEEGDEVRFSMSLDYSMLGQMDVLVSMDRPVINVKILMDDRDRTMILNKYLPGLEQGLRDSGFSPGLIICEEKTQTNNEGMLFPINRGSSASIHLVI